MFASDTRSSHSEQGPRAKHYSRHAVGLPRISAKLLLVLSYCSLFLISALLPARCSAASLDVQPHDVMLNIAMPSARNARRLLQSAGVAGGQMEVQRCPRDTVASGRAPLAWFYAAAQGGLPQYGLPKASLITTGFADRPYVYQWQGTCFAVVVCTCQWFAYWSADARIHMQVVLARPWRQRRRTTEQRA